MDRSCCAADEIDAVGTKRYDAHSGGEREIQRTMLELLNQLDGFDALTDVKVGAAAREVWVQLRVVRVSRSCIEAHSCIHCQASPACHVTCQAPVPADRRFNFAGHHGHPPFGSVDSAFPPTVFRTELH